MPTAETNEKAAKPSPIAKFVNRVSRGIRNKSPVRVPAAKERKDSSGSDVPAKQSPFGTLVNRLSFRRHNRINKEVTGSVSREDVTAPVAPQWATNSPRAAVSETDLRFVTIRRGTEMPSTPLAGASQFISEDNLAAPMEDASTPKARVPSYVNISCSLNGYRSPRPAVENTPIRPKPLGKSLLQLRLEQLNGTPTTSSSTVTSAADCSPMGAATSSPSVKNLIGQFDRLHLCSDAEDSDSKENIKPHQIVVDQPEPVKVPPPAATECTAEHDDATASTSTAVTDEHKQLKAEEKEDKKSSPLSSARSGQEFKDILQSTRRSLEEKADLAMSDLDKMPDMPDNAADSIRMAAGKAKLLMKKKLGKFDELVGHNLNPESASKLTTNEDLEGYWGLVEIELGDIDKCFDEVEQWRSRQYKEAAKEEQKSSEVEEKEIMSSNNNDEKPPVAKKPSTTNRPTPPKVISEKQRAGEEQRRKALAEAKARAKKAAEAAQSSPQTGGLLVL